MKKILWVDDNLTYNLRRFVDEFEDKDISILKAYNASEGIDIFERFKDEIDAVILDMMMDPGKNLCHLETKSGFISGLVLARLIKKKEPKMPVIGFSIIAGESEIATWFVKNKCLLLDKQETSPEELVQKVENKITGILNKKLKTFIVHGHDDKTKLELKNYIQNILGIGEPIILHERPSLGRSIIKKFEEETRSVDFVFVLLTPDDIGASASDPDLVKRRARQNVIFEMGFFYGALKRRHGKVVLLYKGDLELPSDISGVIYIDISNGIEAAGEQIRRELSDTQ